MIPSTSSIISAATDNEPVPRIKSFGPEMSTACLIPDDTSPDSHCTRMPSALAVLAIIFSRRDLGCLDFTAITTRFNCVIADIISLMSWPDRAPNKITTLSNVKFSWIVCISPVSYTHLTLPTNREV